MAAGSGAGMSKGNRYLEAFKEHGNLVGLASAASLSLATLNPLPLVVGLAAEAAYLIFLPDSKWYEKRLAARNDAEVVKRRQQLKAQILPTLRTDVQERFADLEEIRRQIGAQPVEGSGGARGGWLQDVLRKLDFLLDKFLHFACKEMQFRKHLRAVLAELRGESGVLPGAGEFRSSNGNRRGAPSRIKGRQPASSEAPESLPRDPDERWVRETVGEIQAHYNEDISDVQGCIERETDLNTKAVLQKRLEVLQRRHEFVGKIGRILTNLNHQLKLVEDTFGLINDELRARSPEQVLADIEDVVWQTNSMTTLLDEVAPYEQMLQRLST